MGTKARQSLTGRNSRKLTLLETATIIVFIFCVSASLRTYIRRASSSSPGWGQLHRSNSNTAAELLLLPQVSNVHAASNPSPFIITVITASRPGNVMYLHRTIQSLRCALQPTAASNSPQDFKSDFETDSPPQHGHSTSIPPVLVVNTEVPASQHTAFKTLKQQQQQASASKSSQGATAAATAGRDTSRRGSSRPEAAATTALTAALKISLSFMEVGSLHKQLRSQDFVLELVRRSPEGFKGNTSAGDAASDPASRFWWRSKEALDTALVLEAGLRAAPGAKYVIFLQDDVILAPGFVEKLAMFVANHSTPEDTADVTTLWSFGSEGPGAPGPVKGPVHFGCVAFAIRASMVPDLVAYIRAKFADAPVDWLLKGFISDKKKSLWTMHPNLVQHVGVNSSLAGKQQKLQSSSFKDTTCVIPEAVPAGPTVE